MKKLFYFILAFLILGLGGVFGYYLHTKKEKELKIQLEQKNMAKLIKEIKNSFSSTVKMVNDTKIYCYEQKYNDCGSVSKDFELSLETPKNFENKYFKIKDTEYYVYYKDIIKIDGLTNYNGKIRYDKFIPFNEDLIVNKDTKIEREDGTFINIPDNKVMSIVYKDDNKYGIIYDNQIAFVSKDGANTSQSTKSQSEIAKKVLTLTYHFIYDPQEKSCNQDICQTLELFESHLKYLKEENYLALRLDEFELFLDGKINLPKNSIVLTIDDGYISDKVYDLLKTYETYATLFVITGHFDNFDRFKADYLDLQSHTNSMHKQYECRGMGTQGGGLLCRDINAAIEDLVLSKEKLGGDVKYISYPFFDFNNHAIQIVKDAGFKMAFIGQWNTEGYAKVGTDKYKIPRKTVFNNTTVDVLKQQLRK